MRHCSREERKGAIPRAKLTLRGVLLTDHPMNPVDARGVVTPWEQVWCCGGGQAGGGGAIRVYRTDGSEIRTSRFGAPVRLSGHEMDVALRAQKRRWKKLIGGIGGEFAVTQRFEGGKHRGVLLLIPGLLGVAFASMFIVYVLAPVLQGFRHQTGPTQILTLAAAAGMTAAVLAILGVLATMLRTLARMNVAVIHCTGEGVEAVMRDGERIRRTWAELQRVREAWGTMTLIFSDPPGLNLEARRLRILLEHHRGRLEPEREAKEKRGTRRALVRSAVLFQLGGVACGAAVAWVQGLGAPMPPGRTPLAAYLFVGFGIPLILAVQLWATKGIGQLDRCVARRKRRRERVARASGNTAL